MRHMIEVFNRCSEDFNQHYTMSQLEQIYDAYKACQCRVMPDRWTTRQVEEALCGVTPRWGEHSQEPIY